MKRVIFIASIVVLSCNAFAQTFHAYRFDNQYSIIMKYSKNSDSKMLTTMPAIKFLMFSGDTIKLEGYTENEKVKSHGFVVNNYTYSSDAKDVYIMFPITSEQIGLLKQGIKKYAINTIPEIVSKTYATDKIGVDLYEQFAKLEDELKE